MGERTIAIAVYKIQDTPYRKAYKITTNESITVTVSKEVRIDSDPSSHWMPSEIHWSSYGAVDIGTAEGMAAALTEAIRIGREMDLEVR